MRCDGFTITVTVRDRGDHHVLQGTPATVLQGLAVLPGDAPVTGFASVLAPTRTPTSGLRRPGWWG